MTEQNFQVPPIPKAPTPISPISSGTPQPKPSFPEPTTMETPQAKEMESTPITTSDTVTKTESSGMITDLGLPSQLLQTKIVIIILVGILFFGMILGSIIFGGSSPAPTQSAELQGIVRNPEIKQNLARCGMADRTAACVLYIVNASRNDRLAEEFFDEAVKLTGRQKYLLGIENLQYAKQRIPPGYFVQIKIPALK